MQQLRRSYSLTDLAERDWTQDRFTDVTEEIEEGERVALRSDSVLVQTKSVSLQHASIQNDFPELEMTNMKLIWKQNDHSNSFLLYKIEKYIQFVT